MKYKLALKNVLRNINDYGIYFFTLTLSVCIFYLFNSIYAQETVISFSHSMHNALKSLTKVINYVSVFVSVILGFLIVYANNYFIKRRNKEFGIYLTLGMERWHVSRILFIETVLIAGLALVIGLAAGIFLSQFMSLFTAKLFEADMTQFKFIIAGDAIFKTIMYFGIIFLIVGMFNHLIFRRCRLIDFIHGGRKNESLKITCPQIAFVIFILALLMLGIAYVLILNNGFINLTSMFYASIGLGIMGTLLFFFSLTGFAIFAVKNKKSYYFDELNAFVMRQLNSKINTNFITMSVVCLTLLLTIGIFSCGMSIQQVISSDLRDSTPYDMSLRLTEEKSNEFEANKLFEDISNHENVEAALKIPLYFKKNFTYGHMVDYPDLLNDYFKVTEVTFVGLSSVNASLELQGKEAIKLDEGYYGVVSDMEYVVDFSQEIINNGYRISIGDTSLEPMIEIIEVNLTNLFGGIMILVEDSYLDELTISSQLLNYSYISSTEVEALAMNNYIESFQDISVYVSKYDSYVNAVSGKAIISFLAIYLGLVFLMISSTILSLQQLSETIENKKRYGILKKLGVDKLMIRKALFKQVGLYFLLPLSLAFIHSIVGLYTANREIMLVGEMNVYKSSFLTAGLVISIYGMYFILTYLGSLRSIERVN